MGHNKEKQVVAIVATYQRDICLLRLMDCLAKQSDIPVLLIVVDNASSTATREICSNHSLSVKYIKSKCNLGCGNGIYQGESWLENWEENWTHLCILDDDVVLPDTAFEQLVDAIICSKTGMSVPLLTDHSGKIWGFPEPENSEQRVEIRRCDYPQEALNVLGAGPHRCCWTTGACQMVSREAFEQAGKHRRDFWMLGEDIEYSMRVATISGACFITDLTVPHLPPVADDPFKVAQSNYKKFLALLQNISYLGFRCRHSFHMWRYVAGNYKRFILTQGVGLRKIRDAISCLFQGAVLGRAAGHEQIFCGTENTGENLNVSAKRLVVMELHHLGDALLSFPFVKGVMQKYDVTVCCRPSQVDIYRWLLPDKKIIVWEPQWNVFGMPVLDDVVSARLTGMDVGVCAWADPRVHLLLKQLRIQRRIGFPVTHKNYYADEASLGLNKMTLVKLWEYFASKVYGPLLDESLERTSRHSQHLNNWRLLSHSIGCEFNSEAPWFNIANKTQQEGLGFEGITKWFTDVPSQKWIIHPGGRLACRRWPLSKFIEIARKMNRSDRRVLLIQPPELDLNIEDLAYVKKYQCQSLSDLSSLVALSHSVLCNDSLIAHIGAALGKEVITLFGDMPACWFAPYHNQHNVVGGGGMRRSYRFILEAASRSLADSITVEAVWEKISETKA